MSGRSVRSQRQCLTPPRSSESERDSQRLFCRAPLRRTVALPSPVHGGQHTTWQHAPRAVHARCRMPCSHAMRQRETAPTEKGQAPTAGGAPRPNRPVRARWIPSRRHPGQPPRSDRATQRRSHRVAAAWPPRSDRAPTPQPLCDAAWRGPVRACSAHTLCALSPIRVPTAAHKRWRSSPWAALRGRPDLHHLSCRSWL
jgi:hypothetical protein